MRTSLLRHPRAIGLLPGVVTLVVPAALIYFTGAVNIGWGLPPPANWLPPLLGCLLLGLGLFLMYQTISLFATVGEGTLAPWDPPRSLVVPGRLPVRTQPHSQRGPLHPVGGSSPVGLAAPAGVVF
jgi:hypothetical protein